MRGEDGGTEAEAGYGRRDLQKEGREPKMRKPSR